MTPSVDLAGSAAAAEHRGGARRGPPQDRLDPDHELGRRERLRQVVVGAVLEPRDPVDRRAARRQDEDRRGACLLVAANRPDDGPAVELGQHQVEDHERRLMRLDRVQRRGPIGGRHDAEPVPLQIRPDEPDDLGVVVDDEDRAVGEGGRLHREHHHPRP